MQLRRKGLLGVTDTEKTLEGTPSYAGEQEKTFTPFQKT